MKGTFSRTKGVKVPFMRGRSPTCGPQRMLMPLAGGPWSRGARCWGASLTQAEGRLADGRPFYFRARRGEWTVSVGPKGAL